MMDRKQARSNIGFEPRRLKLDRPDLLCERALVDGAWLRGEERFEVLNPATDGVIGHAPNLGGREAEAGVAAAYRAQPAWAALAAKDRARLLRRWFDLIEANAEDLARLITAEQGKPLAESRSEVAYAAAFVEWFAEEARRAYGDIIPGHQPDRRLAVLKQPVGVVAAITPWNFPVAMITRKVAPALAAGCTAVVKPSELTPLSALALAKLSQDAGIPDGVLNVVTGQPQPIGQVLVDDMRVAKLSFTGSTAVGKLLAARCMATVKRVSLELGGNAPFIVLDDADLDAAIEGAIASKFRNAGQTCVCANRFLVQARIYDRFADALAARADALVMGNGAQGRSDQGPLINAAGKAKAQSHIDDALAMGARLVSSARPEPGRNFLTPAVLTGVSRSARLNHEETFGPVAGLIRVADEHEAVQIANDTRAGLAAYVFGAGGSRVRRLSEALQYGMVGVNTGLISTEVAPFGGVKESGIGREGSRYGLDEYLDMKLVCEAV